MAYDPNNPQATAAEAEAGAQLVDPVTGQPIGATATYTFAEWCALDPALVDADAAEFARLYPPPVESDPQSVPVPVESAFTRFYGPSSEQKMDRGTLDARMKTLTEQPDPAAPPPPPPPPATA